MSSLLDGKNFKMKTTIPYALYIRKSMEGDDEQVQSLPAQQTELEQIAKKENLQIVGIYEDKMSAKKPYQRENFTRMLKDVEAGKVKGILVWHTNRLSRNPTESGYIQQLLQDGKIQRIRTHEKTYGSNDNAILMSVEAGMANQFIIDLRASVKRGIREKARNGGISGPAPEGYINVTDPDSKRKYIAIDESKFMMIQRVFKLYLTGTYTVGEIKKMLDDQGFLTNKRGERNGGKPISRNNIYSILTNPRYSGIIPDPYEDGVEHKAEFPRMITPVEFDQIQRLLGKKGRTRHFSVRQHFELRGLLKCGECGCSITAERHEKRLASGGVNQHVYYHCTKKRGKCSQKGIRENELFEQLDTLLDSYEISPQLYEWGINAVKEIAKQEIQQRDDIQKVQFTAINKVQQKLDRLVDLVTDGVIDPETFQERSKATKLELALRQDEQKEAASRAKNWYEIVGHTLENLNGITDQFKNGSLNLRRDILLSIGYNPLLINKKVVITPNEWMIPIKNDLNGLKEQLNKVRTEPQQIRKASEEAILSKWYPGQDLNL